MGLTIAGVEPSQIIISKGTTPTATGPIAINTVGTLTINDGVVTGFNATSNYLQCAQKIDFTKENYEIACKFKSTSSTNTTWIFGQGGLTLCLGSGTDANKVEAYITLETSGYAAYKQLFTTTLNNIWSLIFRRTGGARYDLFVADSSGLRQLIKTWNTTENITSGDSSNILRFGGGNTYNQYLTGSIYQVGTYATVDNELWAGQFDDGYMLTDANYLIVDEKLVWANPNIYLQSSGTQYINTGVSSTFDTIKLEAKFMRTGTVSGAEEGIFGGKSSGDNQSATLYNPSTKTQLNTWCGSGTSYTINSSFESDKKYELSLSFDGASGRTWVLNGVSGSSNTANNARSNSGNFAIFADGSTPSSYLIGRYYCAKLTKNGTLVRYLVPVPSGMTIGSYTTPSAGMFDIVNQQFYANSGSGTFTWGKDN